MWKWLNGKKTNIAAGLLIASAVLQQVVGGIFEVNATWLPKTVATLNWVGGLLGSGGLIHKAVKKQ
ncbi:MAG: hypothetical protein ACYTBZ_31075 [Planctomycetota bacterium]|jgi:hypothetical protein